MVDLAACIKKYFQHWHLNMHFIYEEGGEIKGASAIGPAPAGADHYAAQTQFGKRIKLKAKDIWYGWNTGDLEKILQESNELSTQIDMDFLWECSPDTEFKFEEVAKDYFGESLHAAQIIALAIALQAAPIYFRRKGRGQFLRAPEDQLKAALASVERKKKEALLQKEWETQMLDGALPPEVKNAAQQILWSPDKNGILFKAVQAVSQTKGIHIPQLLLELGAVSSALEVHQGKFLKEAFPKGVGFGQQIFLTQSDREKLQAELPQALVKAFSIDDASTTEIDDAFSVTLLENGNYQIGVHIAAPGLAIQPGDAIDQVAQPRMSTVYFPGGKITMLPSEVIAIFSLDEGQYRPALSLYTEVTSEGLRVQDVPVQTKLEQVMIEKNLRLGNIEHIVDEASLEDEKRQDIPFREELSILWRAAKVFHEERQKVRVAAGQRPEKLGPPEANSLPRDFNFEIVDENQQTLTAQSLLQPGLDDRLWSPVITSRQRGSVIDSIVAEWMIFSNQTWGSLLADHELPAIYRAQQGWGAQRTRMQTTPCRHEGLGVENYAWCTSPLRRYADLVNQWQLIAYVKKGVMAKLAAPFAPKDTKIMSLCAEFDATYTSYNTYQQLAEKYWCLRSLSKDGLPWRGVIRVQKEGMVRVELIPLRLMVPELQNAPRGARVLVEIHQMDLLQLTASVRVIEYLQPDDAVEEPDLTEEIIEPVIDLNLEATPPQDAVTGN
jgi:exoribonuclease-2